MNTLTHTTNLDRSFIEFDFGVNVTLVSLDLEFGANYFPNRTIRERVLCDLVNRLRAEFGKDVTFTFCDSLKLRPKALEVTGLKFCFQDEVDGEDFEDGEIIEFLEEFVFAELEAAEEAA